MEERTLETVLREKYNLHEELIAEGRFVAVSDVGGGPAELVGIGISSRCVVVAKVNLSETEGVDYDLMSLTPVSLCRVEIRPMNSFTLGGPINPSRHFMLCSCEDLDEVWEKFVDVINAINTKFGCGISGWKPVELHTVGTMNSNVNQNCMVSEMSDPIDGDPRVFMSQSGLGIEPGMYLEDVEVTFDSFVNDQPAQRQDVGPKRVDKEEKTSVDEGKGKGHKKERNGWVGKLCKMFRKSS